MQKDVLCILLAGGKGSRLKELTDQIAKPAIHFGGKYRIIDFTLSNCTNSGIDTVGIITQYEPIELTSYIGNGSAWDLDVYKGGVTVLPPYTSKQQGFHWQKGTAHAVYRHLNYIELYNPQTLLILSSDHIYKMDYSILITEHLKNQADLTLATIDVDPKETKRFGIVEVEDGRVVSFIEKPKQSTSHLASMGVYCFNYQKLKDTLMKFNSEQNDEIDFGKHIIPHMIENSVVYAHHFNSYWQDIGTIESLWEANMLLVSDPDRLKLDDKNWPIFSNSIHMPAHHAFQNSLIRKSIVCEGSLIFGHVYHSIVSTSCVVGENSTIIKTVVMPGVKIGKNCFIKNAIIKMNVVIPDYTVIDGKDITLITENYLKAKGVE